MWGESNWGGAGRKAPPVKRQAGGMAEALCIASDLGFSIPTPQVVTYFQFTPFRPYVRRILEFTGAVSASGSFVRSNSFGSVLGSELFTEWIVLPNSITQRNNYLFFLLHHI